jgi:hypothetical protein
MATQDPTRAQPRPPFPGQEQEPPGREAEIISATGGKPLH